MRRLLERLEAADKSDYEDVQMLLGAVEVMAEDCLDMLDALEAMPQDGQLPTWWISKVSVAASDISSARDYIYTRVKAEGMDENLVGSLIRAVLPTVKFSRAESGLPARSSISRGLFSVGKDRAKSKPQKAVTGVVGPKDRPRKPRKPKQQNKGRLWYLRQKAKDGTITSDEKNEMMQLEQMRKSKRLPGPK
jgi:hypothetical protein